MVFDSRQQAGKLLAEELRRRKIKPDVVFGLVRGGMAVAAEVAKILGVKLRPLVVRKIGAPGNPEFAVGAAAEGAVWWNREIVRRLCLSPDWQRKQVREKKREIREIRNELLSVIRSDLAAARSDLSIAMVDDGAATGISMMAAIKGIRARFDARRTKGQGLRVITVGLPVASAEAAEMLRQAADQVVILHEDFYLGAVGVYYRQFEQVNWKTVKQLLELSYETNRKTN